MEGNKLLRDIAFSPALQDDYGYYLIKEDIQNFLYHEKSCENFRDLFPLKRTIESVVLVDKKLGFVSEIDFLHWEHKKYRIYIDTLRLSRMCGSLEHTEDLSLFLGKMALASASKCGYSEWVHCDYAIAGTDRVYRASERERRHDVQMVHKVRAVFEGREYLDAGSSLGSLFPNLKANYGGIFQLNENEKKMYQEICNEVCDVSVVWQCGVKRRRILREKKIYRWDDPAFQDHFYEMVSSPRRVDIIRKMLSLSLSGEEDFLFPPKEEVLDKFPILETDISKWVFVDFETDFSKCIYLLGYYTENDGYQCEWADHLDPGSEKPLMRRIYNVLSSYKKEGRTLCYFVAEMNFWKERCRFHGLVDYMDLFDGTLDLSHIFIYSPLIIRNVFNFKLKSIASGLYEMGYIDLKQPTGCVDGAQSVDLAREYFSTRSVELSGILERYNQFDCEIMYEIVVFLQKYICK
jgi:hypothetical protein